MAAGLVHFFARQVGGFHPHIARGEFGLFGQVLQCLNHGPALWQPERQARADVLRIDDVQSHFGPKLPVIATLSLIEHLEIRLQVRLVLEGGAINPLQLGVFLVTFVVRTGNGRQSKCADITRAHHVRPGAEVNEISVLIIRDGFPFGDVSQVAQLVTAWRGPFGQSSQPSASGIVFGLSAVYHALFENMIRFDLLLHLLLNPGEIFGGDPMR